MKLILRFCWRIVRIVQIITTGALIYYTTDVGHIKTNHIIMLFRAVVIQSRFSHIACKWNGTLYFDGDNWKESGVTFYCSSSNKTLSPGCYPEGSRVKCTKAIAGQTFFTWW